MIIKGSLTPMYHFSLIHLQRTITFDGYNLYDWYCALKIVSRMNKNKTFLKVSFLNNLCQLVSLIITLGVNIIMMLMIYLTSY